MHYTCSEMSAHILYTPGSAASPAPAHKTRLPRSERGPVSGKKAQF